jgi:hypothetical protein
MAVNTSISFAKQCRLERLETRPEPLLSSPASAPPELTLGR